MPNWCYYDILMSIAEHETTDETDRQIDQNPTKFWDSWILQIKLDKTN